MNSSLLFQQLEKNVNAIKKECGAFGKKNLKDSIAKSLSNLEKSKKSPESVDFDTVMKPFFVVFSENYKEMTSHALDLATSLFQYSSDKISPNADTTSAILNEVFPLINQAKIIADQSKAKIGKLISSIIEKPLCRRSLHGEILGRIFGFLVRLQVSTPTSTGEILSMTTQNLSRLYIDLVTGGPSDADEEPKTIKQVAEMCISTCLKSIIHGDVSGQQQQSYQGNDEAERDVITIVRTFSHLVESGGLNPPTLATCGESLLYLLESDNPMLKRKSFEQLLTKDIHVALIGLSLNTHESLLNITSRLITVVWKKFPQMYLVGLNEVLDKGLATALASPYPSVVVRAIKLFTELVQNPQLLVDAFVNYDCDQSGFFRNIYKNIVEKVVNYAKPGQQVQEMQPAALNALIVTLKNLWQYFNIKNEKKEAVNEVAEEAQNYLDAKKAKDVFDQGLRIFKGNERKGLKFFQDHSLCGSTPKEIADFLFNTPSLDPASIGQIIGGSKPENLQILHVFINMFDFKGLSFEGAFRAFLSKFLIPGESQMIDRIMEQFGSKFYNDNRSLFSCAETVYVLAFSALMLHTDAHHPTIKKHMTLPEFIQNNKGIDEGHDLPDDFLTELYKGITSKKIFVSQNALPSSGLLTREQQADMYRQQCIQALQSARENSTDSKGLVFHRSESPLLIGPMFQTIWGPILAALTMSFEESENKQTIELCISGFELSLHIASHCYVEEALQTLVDSFAKFTRLRASSIDEVKPKNIMCTNALISCAIEDHMFLRGAWSIVLGEISALDVLQDSSKFVADMNSAEGVFTHSSKLDRESILDFVGALCKISGAELEENPPRLFSLLKLTDIAYFNMDRPLYLWKEIWGIIGRFLSFEGSSMNETVAQNTVEILRQLARKFIPKQDKGSSISLQSHFLQPFYEIFNSQSSPVIKELILVSTQQLIQEHAPILCSGWDVIFQILRLSAIDDKFKQKGFALVQQIIQKHMTSVVPYAVHLVMMLSTFVTNDVNAEISYKATANFSIIADAIPTEQCDTWCGLFQCLGKCNQHPLITVKQTVEEIFISIVIDKGITRKSFSSQIWSFIFDNALRYLFEFPENEAQDIFKHNIDLLNNIIDNLVIKNISDIKPYTLCILHFISFLGSTSNKSFTCAVVSSLDRYLTVASKDFEDSNIEELLNILQELAPNCGTFVQYVKMIGKTIYLFPGNEEVYHIIMMILLSISDQLEVQNTEDIIEALCSVRFVYLQGLVYHKESQAAALYMKHSLQLFLRVELVKESAVFWNQLIEQSLSLIVESSEDIFNVCIEASTKDLLSAIETESPNVRKELIRIMKRKLSK